MPVYEYAGISPGGGSAKGSIDADSPRSARQKLRGQGIYPTNLKEVKEAGTSKDGDIRNYFERSSTSIRELSVATRQFATLVGAGLPLVNALQSLSEQVETRGFRRTLVEVREKVEEGSSLAKAMGAFPKSFPRLYVNMVASGEASGTLEAVLENLADHLEAQLELRRKISSSLFYPILMFGFCTLVVIGLLAFVVPSIVEIFEKQGAILPLPTRILLGLSSILTGWWWLIIAIVCLVALGLKSYYGTAKGRAEADLLLMKLPVFGGLYRKIITARVSGTIGTLLASGVGLLTALDIARNTVGNVHIRKVLEESSNGVREGRSLAKELARGGYFPPLLSQMTAIGEQSGRLDQMLHRAAKSFENDVNASLAGLTSLIEPIMIIVLGMIVFAIVASVMLPILDLINLVQM